jgi:hypothetical protein
MRGCSTTAGLRATASLLESNPRHALSNTAFVNKIALQTTDLLVEKIVGLVNETDRNIGDDFSWSGLAEVAKVAVCGLILGGEAPNEQCLAAIFLPNSTLPRTKKIVIVVEQLFQAGPCSVR